jgi:pimeloyl-ACP methyl ester carboxylesterase
MDPDTEQDLFLSAPDGLQLHVRQYGPRAGGTPVVCLPGLARTAADFEMLARALAAADKTQRILALDYRGRGLSAYDRNPANYSLPVELADVLAVLTALDATPAIFIGTSRGGLLTLLMAALRPTAIVGAVLNDIGPVIEPKGLMRIKGYVGKLPQPASYEDAAEILRRLFDAQFPKVDKEGWLAAAQRSYKQRNGRLVANYDPALAKTLASLAPGTTLPTLWNEFDALARTPLLLIRGQLSDILSPETVERMRSRQPSTEYLDVADEGHAPLLADQRTITRIVGFVGRCRQKQPIGL